MRCNFKHIIDSIFKSILIVLPVGGVGGGLLISCQSNSEENFANKAYIDATSMTAETLIKGKMDVVSKTLSFSTARPVETQVNAQAVVNTSLLDTYNKAYYDDAELLPTANYEVTENSMTIEAGSVKSTDAQFNFKSLSDLDRNTVYVLPVTIQTSDIDFLESARNFYYVFKAGALINVVADIEENYLELYPWANADRVAGMHQITMEALIYPRQFGQLISTVMGIEGHFLMRIGDAGLPDNQIQIATANGNFTDSKLSLETNKWQHVAVTYDQDTKEMKVYINGRCLAEGTFDCTVDILGNGSDRNFEIGRSYDDSRDLNGCISEVRVWDVVRTQEEIADNFYTVDATDANLVAYWKFDDQSTYKVHDYTGNGNDITAKSQLKWKSVSLPN